MASDAAEYTIGARDGQRCSRCRDRRGAEGLPGRPVRPHITLGYLDDQAALRRLVTEVDSHARGMIFRVDAMHVTYGNETCVWRKACTYTLGGGAP